MARTSVPFKVYTFSANKKNVRQAYWKPVTFGEFQNFSAIAKFTNAKLFNGDLEYAETAGCAPHKTFLNRIAWISPPVPHAKTIPTSYRQYLSSGKYNCENLSLIIYGSRKSMSLFPSIHPKAKIDNRSTPWSNCSLKITSKCVIHCKRILS